MIEGRRTRSQVKVLQDDSGEVVIGVTLLDSSVRVTEDGQGLGDSNGVGQLNLSKAREISNVVVLLQ